MSFAKRVRGKFSRETGNLTLLLRASWPYKHRVRRAMDRVPLDSHYAYDVECRVVRTLSMDGIVVDVGAHSGLHSIEMEDKVGASQLVIFEPLPGLARQLRRRFPRALVVETALSDR